MADFEAYHHYLTRVLTLAARTDTINEINWTLGLVEDRVTFVAEVGNLFSETEWEQVPIGQSDVDALEQAFTDVGSATGGDFTFGPALYACRVRGQRPCNMGWPTDPRVAKLFESAGPKRGPALPPPPPLTSPLDPGMVPPLPQRHALVPDALVPAEGWPPLPGDGST